MPERRTKSKSGQVATSGSPVKSAGRSVRESTRLLLFVRAGGRCQFDGCNEYLLEHPLTLADGNFSQVAHIVAFSRGGPRGKDLLDSGYVNDIANLMLLCLQCHKLIDDHPEQYTVLALEKYKERHEDRIRHVTGLGPDLKTSVVQLKARIAGQSVAIRVAQVTEAVAPRYPTDARGYIIDLTTITAEGRDFVSVAAQTIQQKIARLYEPGMDVHETRHISLFALAPIPILVYLGNQISNKVPVDTYQRHRDTEDWVWKDYGTPVDYRFHRLRDGSDRASVALVVSLSGKIHLDALPKEIDLRYSIYELTLAGIEPNPSFLRRREDLINFGETYRLLLRTIAREHGQIEAIHLFPAVPAPVAVLCGRELLPKVDPSLFVYDYDKRAGGFSLTIEVN